MDYLFNFFYSFSKSILKKKNEFLDIIFNIISVFSIFICIFYWILVFPIIPKEKYHKSFIEKIYYETNEHVLPFIFIILEYNFNKTLVFKYKNIYYIFIFTIVYSIVNFIFMWIIKDSSYPVLDLKNYKTILIILTGYSFIFFIFMILTFIRKKYYKKIN